MEIRKIVTVVEETYADKIRRDKPTRKCAAVAVVKNPCAGRYVEDLSVLYEIGGELGTLLTRRAIEGLGITAQDIHDFGKAVIVGEGGELEHAAAILHPKLGDTLREVIKAGKAVIPSAKKLGGIGTGIDVPLHYKDAMMIRSHYDAMEVRLPDAPRHDELVVAIVLTDGGRPFARVGGHLLENLIGDGIR